MEHLSALPVQGACDREQHVELSQIEAAQADAAKFEPIYQQYMPRVYRYIRTRVSSDEVASDLTQQVFLKVLDALPKYRARGIPFAAWLFRIVKHVVTDQYRRRKNNISWDALPDVVETLVEHNPEMLFLYKERITHLRVTLANLDSDKRELLALRFAAGLSTSEIATLVGKSQAAIKKQLTRTLYTLREQYNHE